jgi:hypothetical protein
MEDGDAEIGEVARTQPHHADAERERPEAVQPPELRLVQRQPSRQHRQHLPQRRPRRWLLAGLVEGVHASSVVVAAARRPGQRVA